MFEQLDVRIGYSKYFYWREALLLSRFGMFASPPDALIESNIRTTALRMDMIRELFDCPILITSWYRPEKYNSQIGGAKASSHIQGLACDFMVKGMTSIKAREILKPHLQKFNIRMEAINTPHVHIDLNCDESLPLKKRVFFP